MSISRLVLLALALLGGTLALGEDASEVKIFESTVTVKARVECRRYEGKVRHCTTDPSKAVAEALDPKLVLGFNGLQIGEHVFATDRVAGTEIRFVPAGEKGNVDVSGNREMKVSVIYVK